MDGRQAGRQAGWDRRTPSVRAGVGRATVLGLGTFAEGPEFLLRSQHGEGQMKPRVPSFIPQSLGSLPHTLPGGLSSRPAISLTHPSPTSAPVSSPLATPVLSECEGRRRPTAPQRHEPLGNTIPP